MVSGCSRLYILPLIASLVCTSCGERPFSFMLLVLRMLSLLVIMVVPAVGIFMLCDGMRDVP